MLLDFVIDALNYWVTWLLTWLAYNHLSITNPEQINGAFMAMLQACGGL